MNTAGRLGPILVAFVALVVSGPGQGMAVQAPGMGWRMSPGKEHEIKLLYYAPSNQTEVWTYLVPKAADTAKGPLQLRLVVSATLRGKALKLNEVSRLPRVTEVSLQAQPDWLVTVVRPSLSWVARDGRLVDLMRDGRAWSLQTGCPDCSPDVAGRIGVDELLDLARSGTVEAELLGLKSEFDEADTEALRNLARHLALLP